MSDLMVNRWTSLAARAGCVVSLLVVFAVLATAIPVSIEQFLVLGGLPTRIATGLAITVLFALHGFLGVGLARYLTRVMPRVGPSLRRIGCGCLTLGAMAGLAIWLAEVTWVSTSFAWYPVLGWSILQVRAADPGLARARRWFAIAPGVLLAGGVLIGIDLIRWIGGDRDPWTVILQAVFDHGYLMVASGLLVLLSGRGGDPSSDRRRGIVLLHDTTSAVDRPAIASVLRRAPRGSRVLFAVPPAVHPLNWDPALWCFAGIRLRGWLGSMPEHVAVPQDDQADREGALLDQAGRIVLCVSGRPGDTPWERRIADDEALAAKTAVLIDRSSPYLEPLESGDHPLGRVSLVVPYRTGWRRAMPSLALGLVCVGLVYGLGASPLGMNFMGIGLAETHTALDSLSRVLLSAVLGPLLAIAAYVALVVRPSVDAAAERAIGRWLATPASPPPDRRPTPQEER